MLTRRSLRRTFVLPALAATLAVNGTVLPVSSQTTDSASCGIEAVKPCELTSHKLVPNPNDPEVYVLQVETKQGPRSFVATKPVLERFARELLDALEGRVKPL